MYNKIRAALDLHPLCPGLAALSTDTMYLMGCRSFEQFCCTCRSLEHPEQFCPFCQAELTRRGRRAIYEEDGWMLLDNEFPHKATKRMMLIVPKRHLTHFNPMAAGDWVAMSYMLEASGIQHGGLLLRFGYPMYNVGTIEHLHFNVIEPKPGTEYRPPLAKEVMEHIQDYDRLLGFKKQLDEKGGIDWLFSVDGIVQTQPATAKQ